ncbi:hypothetical protein EIP91_004499 [Steccherinum ochraceum]|uniref:Uncharacterized protein n=1 Tax=Steccherinum ochraceum TaxID=92696 RepID=A0A4R0R8Q2_9APHY|nr:hypothetical protein EIP91_004499 [Steccherinum ochraceum]
MPSLRRTFSSPTVRSSPYSSSSSSAVNQPSRQGGHGPRRSLGTETGGRRVLADIDWWTVHAGQIHTPGYAPPPQIQDAQEDPQTEQEFPLNNVNNEEAAAEIEEEEEESTATGNVWHTALPGSGAGATFESGPAQVPYAFGATFDESFSALSQFSALSITPRIMGERRSTVSSDSSVESTPSSRVASLSPMLDLGFSDFAAPSVHFGFESVPLNASSPSRPSRQGSMTTRSVSYSFYETAREQEQRFDDIPCYSAETFSCTMADVDDLFFQ